MSLTDLALQYLRAFAAKDLDAIRPMFGPAMTLRDWAGAVSGREQVLAQMKASLDSVRRVEVTPVNVYQQGRTVIAELTIAIDAETLHVIDLIEFSADAKILAIRAFKG